MKSKRGRGIFFLSFYAIFFALVILFYSNLEPLDDNKTNLKNENKEQEIINNSTDYYETKKLESSNYLYKIEINDNNEVIKLEGNANNQEDIINYRYHYLIELFELKRIVKNAKFLSKDLVDDYYLVNYEIKTSSLSKLFDIENEIDTINTISLKVDSSNNLVGFDLDFSNYLKSINENNSIYKVKILYEY